MIIGLDPSLLGFGACKIDETTGRLIDAKTFAQASQGETWRDRSARYQRLVYRVCTWIEATDLPVFIESYAFSAKGRAHQTGELGAYVRLMVSRAFRTQIVEVTPSELKQWVTGKGRAKKGQPAKDRMLWSVQQVSNYKFADDNQVDAFGLAWMGTTIMGYSNPQSDLHEQLAEKILKRNRVTPIGPFRKNFVKS